MELNLGGTLMKKVIRYFGMSLLLVVSGMISSCIKDKFPAEEVEGTSNVIVKLDSRAADGNALENEGIKTLRLILVQNGKIVINSKHDFTTAEGKPLLTQGISIIGLKKAATSFYAVVNEESTGVTFDEKYFQTDDFNKDDFMKSVLKSGTTFPTSYITDKGLPMRSDEVFKSEAELTDGITVEIPVERIVARIDFNLINETGSPLAISSINFGEFFPSQTQLGNFAPGTYSSKSFGERVSIPSDAGVNSHKFTYYLYESKAGAGNYTVSLNDATEYPAVSIKNNGTNDEITELLRNQILSVNATARSTGWELVCNVNPWKKEDINISFEDNLSYTEGKWTEGTYLNLIDNTIVQLHSDKSAELTFTIQSPSGAKWRASLEGDINAFAFDGPNEGIAGEQDENGNVPVQTLKIKVTDPESQDRHEAQLHVFVYIGGKSYELDLTEGENTPGGNPVRNYTILQSF